MTSFDQLSPEEQAVLELAAEWWERLRLAPHRELSPEFVEWLAEPRHAKAMSAVRESMEALATLGTASPIIEMRYSALARLRNADFSRRFSMRVFALAAAVVIAVGTGIGTYLWYRAFDFVTYRTAVGERHLVTLADGSHISLDSNSALRVRLSHADRTIILDKGQARFDVTHDASRPFTVAAGDVNVVAIGTAFDVEALDSKVLVTLIQGRVVVDSTAEHPGTRPFSIHLTAGQQLISAAGVRPIVREANLVTAGAWEAGHLIFRGEPLGDAVQRINRYAANPIEVAPDAASILISGVFNAGDVRSFISAITGYFPVNAATNSANRIRLEKRT